MFKKAVLLVVFALFAGCVAYVPPTYTYDRQVCGPDSTGQQRCWTDKRVETYPVYQDSGSTSFFYGNGRTFIGGSVGYPYGGYGYGAIAPSYLAMPHHRW